MAANGKLDYETLDSYLLTLTVSDGIHNATTRVRVDLLDVNDNPPVFTEPPPYEVCREHLILLLNTKKRFYKIFQIQD